MNKIIRKRLSAIIPAAGFSSRMKDFKPLLPFGDKTIVEQVIDLFKANRIKDIIVVTGYNHAKLDPVVRKAGALPVFNPDFESGMLSSIQKGLRNIRPENAGFFLLPVDIPAIRPSTIEALIQKWDEAEDRILIPCFGDIPGHPPLIPARFKSDILSLSNGSSLRDLLLSQTGRTMPVKVYDRGVLMDADDKTGYEVILQKFLSLHVPDKEECLAIINDILPDNDAIRIHLADVSFTALKIANALSDKIDPDHVIAAGLLHDIKRMEKHYAEAGAKVLDDLGFYENTQLIQAGIEASAGKSIKEILSR